MKIAGLHKLSLIDYPGRLSAVVFVQECNFRCPYCHNPELVYPTLYQDLIPVDRVLEFLGRRQGKLEGVVISGGEPTLQEGLPAFIRMVKALGYLVKLDTNGTRPRVLANLLEQRLLDYIAMDIKAPLAKYEQACGVGVDLASIQQSISLIEGSGLDHLFRTTFASDILDNSDLEEITTLIKDPSRHLVQECLPSK